MDIGLDPESIDVWSTRLVVYTCDVPGAELDHQDSLFAFFGDADQVDFGYVAAGARLDFGCGLPFRDGFHSLDTARPDFRRAGRDVFEIPVFGNLSTAIEDLTLISEPCQRLTDSDSDGTWCLEGIELWINDERMFEHRGMRRWMTFEGDAGRRRRDWVTFGADQIRGRIGRNQAWHTTSRTCAQPTRIPSQHLRKLVEGVMSNEIHAYELAPRMVRYDESDGEITLGFVDFDTLHVTANLVASGAPRAPDLTLDFDIDLRCITTPDGPALRFSTTDWRADLDLRPILRFFGIESREEERIVRDLEGLGESIPLSTCLVHPTLGIRFEGPSGDLVIPSPGGSAPNPLCEPLPGGTCQSNLNCTAVRDSSVCIHGLCYDAEEGLRAVGQSCDEDVDCVTGRCAGAFPDTTCQSLPCTSDTQCAAGPIVETCVDGACARRSREAEPCDPADHDDCRSGLTCDTRPGELDHACWRSCSDDATCSDHEGCVDGICVDRGQPGTRCDSEGDCSSGSCVRGECRECWTNADCDDPGETCVFTHCIEIRSACEWCDDHADCASGLTCSSSYRCDGPTGTCP